MELTIDEAITHAKVEDFWMIEELNVKVGDKLLYQRGYAHNQVERIVTVTKVTPTGRIRVDYSDKQYDKYGNEMGSRDIWTCRSSLHLPKEEDYERIKVNNTIAKALLLMGNQNKETLSYEQAVKIIEILEPKEKM